MKILDSLKAIWMRWRSDPALSPVSPDYSYRLFWTKQAMGWSMEERRKAREAVLEIVAAKGFEPNTYGRRYTLESIGVKKHAGASVLELKYVLDGFEQIEQREVVNDD